LQTAALSPAHPFGAGTPPRHHHRHQHLRAHSHDADEDPAEMYECRADGMKEAALLTYAFYAPWVQAHYLSAAKTTAHEIRTMIRANREAHEAAQVMMAHCHSHPHSPLPNLRAVARALLTYTRSLSPAALPPRWCCANA